MWESHGGGIEMRLPTTFFGRQHVCANHGLTSTRSIGDRCGLLLVLGCLSLLGRKHSWLGCDVCMFVEACRFIERGVDIQGKAPG